MVTSRFLPGVVCIVGLVGCGGAEVPDTPSIRTAVEYRLDVESRHVLELERRGRCKVSGESGNRYRCPLQVTFYDQRDLDNWIDVETSGRFPVTTLDGSFTFERPEEGPSWQVTDNFHYEREAADQAVELRDDLVLDRRDFEQRVQDYVAREQRGDQWRVLFLVVLAIALVVGAIGAWDRQSQTLRKAKKDGRTFRPRRAHDEPNTGRRPMASAATPIRDKQESHARSTFPALASIHGGWQNRLILVVLVVLVGSLLACFVGLPFAFVFGDDHWDVSYAQSPVAAIGFLIVYFGVFAGALVWLLKYAARAQHLAHDALLVDDVGVHFLRGKCAIRQIAYADILCSPGAGADLTLESISRSTGRGGRVTQYFVGLHSRSPSGEVERHRLDFHGKRPGYSYFSNRHELIAAFLRGVSRFRPDLRIESSVFSHYYIDPATGRYDRDRRITTEILGTVVAILLTAGVFAVAFFMTG